MVVESKLSDQIWLSFSLALAKPNKIGRNRGYLRFDKGRAYLSICSIQHGFNNAQYFKISQEMCGWITISTVNQEKEDTLRASENIRFIIQVLVANGSQILNTKYSQIQDN